MKISALNSFNINFRANFSQEENDSVHHMADDYGGQKIRGAIRAHIYPQFLFMNDPYDEYMPECAASIDDVFIPNIENIGAGSYKGASLFRNPEYLDLLKKSNIKTIVDLAGFNKLRDACEQKNINYYRYYIPLDYWSKPIFITNEELFGKKENELYKQALNKQEFLAQMQDYKQKTESERKAFMDEFIDFTNVMNEGSLYIGCDLGEFRTPNVLALNTYFNPKWQGDKIEPTTEFIRECIKNMYNNLSAEDKNRLGFTEEFDENLRTKLNIKKDGN